MSNPAPEVYNYAADKVVKITAGPNSSMSSTGTGLIIGVYKKRLIIITCAHEILANSGTRYPTSLSPPYVCTVTNAIASGHHNKGENISINLFLIGMDISADVAVLGTYLESEIDPSNQIFFGFNFSKKNAHFSWGNSATTPVGTQVYSLTNAYAEGISESTGIIHDNNFVFATDNSAYLNQTVQVLTSMNVDQGSSGAPVLIVNNNCKKGDEFALLIGMVAWLRVTTGGNFIGGPAQKQMQKSYNKILRLNGYTHKVGNNQPITNPINFDGTTGKGFLGIAAYAALDQQLSFQLNEQYEAYALSKYSNKIGGFVITQITDPANPPIIVPNSRVNNAVNVKTGLASGLQINDIIIEVNGVKVDLNTNPEYVTFDSYNDINKPINMKIIRPSIGKSMRFNVISDQYPASYEIISQVSGVIELITNLKFNIGSEPAIECSSTSYLGNTASFVFVAYPIFPPINGLPFYTLNVNALSDVFADAGITPRTLYTLFIGSDNFFNILNYDTTAILYTGTYINITTAQ